MNTTYEWDRFCQTTKDIQAWARQNFDNNESKAMPGIVLGPLAPLLGQMEEIGEMFGNEVGLRPRREDLYDGYADFLIFSCDYFGRMPEAYSFEDAMIQMHTLTASRQPVLSLMAQLCHCNLKLHQGIRGYAEPTFARHQIVSTWSQLAFELQAFLWPDPATSDQVLHRSLACLQDVWTKIVAKRDWKENPTEGAGSSDT